MAPKSKYANLKNVFIFCFLTWLLLTTILFLLFTADMQGQISLNQYLRFILAPIKGDSIISRHYHQPVGPILRERTLKSLIIIIPSLCIASLIAYRYSQGKNRLDCLPLTISLYATPLFWLAMLFIAFSLKMGLSIQANVFFTVFLASVHLTSIFLTVTHKAKIQCTNHTALTWGIGKKTAGISANDIYLYPFIVNQILRKLPFFVLFILGNYMLLEFVTGWGGLGREFLQSLFISDMQLALAISLYVTGLTVFINLILFLMANFYPKNFKPRV